ncbi:MAG: universal stress protein [Pirellulales bacterium]
MNILRILCPTDFSGQDSAALDYASRLARESGALLLIVHVDDMGDLNALMGEAGYLYGTTEAARQEAKERLSRVKPTVANVRYEHHYLTGSPVAELLKFAECEEVDLIVMGSHGRTGLSRLLMGSIAEGVMRKATCPVLIVKQPLAAVEDVSPVFLSGETVE